MLNAVKKMLLQSISLRHPEDERSTREKIYKDTMFSKDWVSLYRWGALLYSIPHESHFTLNGVT
jgi:uncharacterized protein (DUF2461 family)